MIKLNEPEMAYPDDVLEVITTDDLRLKLIGEVMANDTSRGVLKAVLKGFDTASNISKMLDLSLPLVLHHLERLVDSGLLTVKEIDHSLKGRDMKRYSASKMAFLIIPSDVLEDKKETISKLRRSAMRAFFKRILYSLVGLAVATGLSLLILPMILPPFRYTIYIPQVPVQPPGNGSAILPPIEVVIYAKADALPISIAMGIIIFLTMWIILGWRARHWSRMT
ncbi:MAG: winged helix-turn-helix transcriptional regulator [Nitrososphaerales archaeon]|nr:winged helix-turn-helix transcriptional regulator [Nitrososphaerales archaeon]